MFLINSYNIDSFFKQNAVIQLRYLTILISHKAELKYTTKQTDLLHTIRNNTVFIGYNVYYVSDVTVNAGLK